MFYDATVSILDHTYSTSNKARSVYLPIFNLSIYDICYIIRTTNTLKGPVEIVATQTSPARCC